MRKLKLNVRKWVTKFFSTLRIDKSHCAYFFASIGTLQLPLIISFISGQQKKFRGNSWDPSFFAENQKKKSRFNNDLDFKLDDYI